MLGTRLHAASFGVSGDQVEHIIVIRNINKGLRNLTDNNVFRHGDLRGGLNGTRTGGNHQPHGSAERQQNAVAGLVDAGGLKLRIKTGGNGTHRKNLHAELWPCARKKREPKRRTQRHLHKPIFRISQLLLGKGACTGGKAIHGGGISLKETHLSIRILDDMNERIIAETGLDGFLDGGVEDGNGQRACVSHCQGERDPGEIMLHYKGEGNEKEKRQEKNAHTAMLKKQEGQLLSVWIGLGARGELSGYGKHLTLSGVKSIGRARLTGYCTV